MDVNTDNPQVLWETGSLSKEPFEETPSRFSVVLEAEGCQQETWTEEVEDKTLGKESELFKDDDVKKGDQAADNRQGSSNGPAYCDGVTSRIGSSLICT